MCLKRQLEVTGHNSFCCKALYKDYNYIHSKILCHHHWDINIKDQPHSYFQIHYKGRICYPGSWYNCSGPNTTRAERQSCMGFRTAATASLYTTVVGLRLTPLLWSHLRQLLMFLLHLLEVMSLVGCHC